MHVLVHGSICCGANSLYTYLGEKTHSQLLLGQKTEHSTTASDHTSNRHFTQSNRFQRAIRLHKTDRLNERTEA